MYIDIHSHQPSAGAFWVENIQIWQLGQTLPMRAVSVGIHPYDADKIDAKSLEKLLPELEALARQPQVLALGEAGLDKHIAADWGWQVQIFEQQLLLNKRLDKPFIVHSVAAHQEIAQLYKRHRCQFPLIFHGFNKKNSVAQTLLREGFWLSFGAALLHNPSCQDSFRQAPKTQIFLETDAQSQHSIQDIYRQAAQLCPNADIFGLKRQIFDNFNRIFEKKANFAPVFEP